MFEMAGSLDPTKVLKTGDTMTGNLIIGANTIVNDATNAKYSSNTGYIRVLASGGGLLIVGFNGGSTYVGINNSHVFFPVQAPTGSAPAYVKGGIYFDTTRNKLMVSEGADWQTKGNFNNLLAPLTPTFANWTQNPGTNANMTDELIGSGAANLSTPGIGQAGNNTVIWDLGTSKRRMFDWGSDGVGDQFSISDDGTNWYYAFGAGKFRYLKYVLSGALTITKLYVRCYSLE